MSAMASRSDKDRWQQILQEGMTAADRRYGHLSRQAISELGRKGAIPRPVVEYLLTRKSS